MHPYLFNKEVKKMNDNVRISHKYSSIFWWTLTILPFILALLYFLSIQFNINNESITNVTQYHQDNVNAFQYAMTHSLVKEWTPQWLITSMRNLVGQFNVNLTFEFADIIAWCVWVQLIHLLFDILTSLFDLIHNMIKGFGGVR